MSFRNLHAITTLAHTHTTVNYTHTHTHKTAPCSEYQQSTKNTVVREDLVNSPAFELYGYLVVVVGIASRQVSARLPTTRPIALSRTSHAQHTHSDPRRLANTCTEHPQITWSNRRRVEWCRSRRSAPTADAHDGRRQPAGQPEAGVTAAESDAHNTQGFGRLRHEGNHKIGRFDQYFENNLTYHVQ